MYVLTYCRNCKCLWLYWYSD